MMLFRKKISDFEATGMIINILSRIKMLINYIYCFFSRFYAIPPLSAGYTNAVASIKTLLLMIFCALMVSACITGSQSPNQNDRLRLAFEPRAEASASFTDNVTLTDTNRQSDIVLGVSPGISIRRQGPRLTASLDYSVDLLYFINSDETDDRQNLFGLINLEVIEDHLQFEGRASLRETFVDRSGGLSGSIANLSSNRQLVQTYTGTSTYQTRLANWADINTRYTFTAQFSSADDLDDTTQTINFSDTQSHDFVHEVSTGERFGRLNIRAQLAARRVFRSLDVNNFRDDTAFLEVGYRVKRNFNIRASAGYAENNLVFFNNQEDGLLWNAGFTWNPSRRSALSVDLGREGNRSTANINFNFQPTRRITVTGRYLDQIQAVTFELAQGVQSLEFDEDFGVVTQGGLPASSINPTFTLSDVDFRQKIFSITAQWRNRRNRYFINASSEERRFDDGSGTSETWGVSQGLVHQINPRDEISVSSSFRRNIFETGDRVDDFYRATIEYKSVLSRFFIGAVTYNFSYRNSNVQTADLLENSLTLYLRVAF